jgi:general secretion pathway protein M
MKPLKREHAACIIAWSAALLIPAAVILGIGLPWWDRLGELERKISANEQQLTRYQRLIASLPRLRAELEQERTNKEVKAFYYEAQTPALAGAQVQRELQEMVRDTGARLVNSQFIPAGAEEQPPRVRVRAQFQGETDDLLDVLFAIQQARPFLFVDQMSVRSTARRQTRRLRGRRRVVRSQAQGQLTVRLDIYGYALGESQ